MNKPLRLLTLGVFVFIIGLVVHAPVATLYAWIAPRLANAPVHISGLDGTLFKGQAARIAYQERPVVDELQWSFAPLELLKARIGAHVRSTQPPLRVDGVIAQGLAGQFFSDLRASGDLRSLAALAGQSFIPVNAQLGLNLSQLHLRQGWPQQAQGQLQLLDLAWTLGAPTVLGDFEAQISTDGDAIVADIKSLKGALDVRGSARAQADRSYSLDLQLRARADAPPMVVNLLTQLGRPDAEGFYTLKNNGQAAADRNTAPASPAPPAPDQNKTQTLSDLN